MQALSEEHQAAVERRRRIIVNFDVISGDQTFGGRDPEELVAWKFDFIGREGTQIDSVWWEWGEGHQAPWPSRTMPLYDQEGYRRWADTGVDIVQVFLDASRDRGVEAFYEYRINGSDNDLGPVQKIPMKEAHPEWLQWTWNANGYWNFAIEGVRKYKLSIIREIAQRYDVDGIALDFARVCPVLPKGKQWLHRQELTEFMRGVRSVTEAAATDRGRPMLVAARVPENLLGCHYDGLDVESWCEEQLVDLLALGVRSFDVDIEAFRRIAGPRVRLYPSIDDHHASDGYQTPPVEIYRGAAANWWRQGADGIQTFNFNHAMDFPYGSEVAQTHLQCYRELGSATTLRRKDKVFVVQRRGGGHGTTVIPNPEDWSTPRWMYFNTNMLAPLPIDLDVEGRADAMLTVAVADPVAAAATSVERIEVRLLLSDRAAADHADGERLEAVTIATIGHNPQLQNEPPARSVVDEIELRVNGALLRKPAVEGGWLVFVAAAEHFAVGDNLIGILSLSGRDSAEFPMRVEKLEVHLKYRGNSRSASERRRSGAHQATGSFGISLR
jgi:hypothetical protein